MKKVKYLIIIILICIVVFIGIEVLRKVEIENPENTTNNVINTNGNIVEENTSNEPEQNVPIQEEKTPVQQEQVEIQNGQDLLDKADKILTARGWAGSSNNMIGIKDNVLYYYNKGTNEFKKIATGIEDIYYKTELAEDITAKKGLKSEIIIDDFTFLIYE